LCHTLLMPHKRYTVHVGERGRFVLPAEVRRDLGVDRGDVLVLEFEPEDESLYVRRAAEVARGARGLFRDVAPGEDLVAELLSDRRLEAARESEDHVEAGATNARR
jgi:AbrB family transcriptional regulator, stage V sporulation protein T